MKFFTVPALLAAALFSAVAVVPFLPTAKMRSSLLAVEVRFSTSAGVGNVQVFYDTGQGYNEFSSSKQAIHPGNQAQTYRFPLPPGRYSSLRFDPIDRASTISIESIRIASRRGRVIYELPLAQLKPAQQINAPEMRDGRLEFIVPADANDPQLEYRFPAPLTVKLTGMEVAVILVPATLGVFAVLAIGLFLLDRVAPLRERCVRTAGWTVARPGRAIAVVSAVAVIGSAYPVVFLGKSYVSPNVGTTLLYDGFPTLPGYTSAETIDAKGSDVGAVMWAHLPYSVVQSHSLRDFELPLWNRYNSAGTTLLAQGQSMFGDPLNFLVVLCGGRSWAWDLKYLAAKWLFATGLGLIVLALLVRRSAAVPDAIVPATALYSALIVSAAAPFIGFFIFRVNHPAIFSLSYAPWVLYAWVRAAQASTVRATAGWLLLLMAANGSLMNSGTAKEAYMLLLTMNFSGACLLLSAPVPWRVRRGKFAGAAWAGVLFLLLTLPIWGTFLHTLRTAYTTYNATSAYQLQPTIMLGLFDELFYRPLTPMDWVFNPSLNFLLLLGLLYFVATLRAHASDRLTLALAASSLMPLALGFGLVPARWIVQVPFLGNVAHIDNTFSCGLIVLWSVLAGLGFAHAFHRLRTPEGRGDLVVAGLLLGMLVFSWIAFRQAVHRPIYAVGATFSVLQPGQEIPVHRFIWGMLGALLLAAVALGWSARRALTAGRLSPALTLVMATAIATMLWRQGLHARSAGFEDFVVRPAARAPFHAKSVAVDYLREATRAEPARGMGMRGNFFGGWTGVYGLESTFGPDALVNTYYRELTGMLPGVERAWEWRLYLEPQNVAVARRSLDALNVRYYLDYQSDQGVMGRALKLIKTADLDIYESPTAWPRAFFTDRIAVYDVPAQFVDQIAKGDGRPFAAAQRGDLVTGAGATLNQLSREMATRTVAPATAYKLTGNTTAFSVHAAGPGVVVLAETFFADDFRATINGKDAPVVRINHAFKGVTLDAAGDYRIVVRYWPRNFTRDLALAGLGALLLAGSLAFALRRERVA
ncbi:MAG TPA: hypothetical protein VM029_11920 [Opitutaceae bacterium]|nr:hypothetical protein [Opitutaceae bacterium]